MQNTGSDSNSNPIYNYDYCMKGLNFDIVPFYSLWYFTSQSLENKSEQFVYQKTSSSFFFRLVHFFVE